MNKLLTLFIVLCYSGAAQAGARSSASYSIPADSLDIAGSKAQSANYALKTSAAGELGGGADAVIVSSSYLEKNGYAGQLYDLVALSITAPPSTNLNEATSRQLTAAPLADDTTLLGPLVPTAVVWSIVSGPIASISSSGLATAANVYQDTSASVGGIALGLSGQLNLTVLNVNTDDYGAYANDGLDDSWQVQYFGPPPNPLAGPAADADGTGQTNLFKFVAGLNPVDGSRFTLQVAAVAGQPTQKQLIFSPVVAGRTYLPQYRTSLTNNPSWQPVPNTSQSDTGSTRTVTDFSASPAPRYYQVQISRP